MKVNMSNVVEIFIGVALASIVGGIVMVYANKFLERHAEKVQQNWEE